MIFTLLTLLTALALAGVAGWFSIIGIMAIFAGAATNALIMGAVLEVGKIVTTSWLYRNWGHAGWTLKIPLITFTFALMVVTSIGVYGYLSKAHLEQGASTIDNSAKIERLDQQIATEQRTIDSSAKAVAQLDATLDSYIGKDRADRSVVIRKRQEPERKQIKEVVDTAQKRINELSDEKFKLTSEVRALQLEVGPIRYIADLFYGTEGDKDKNIEAAIRIFTLLIVLILDPLAVTLLIAANSSILRRQREKEEQKKVSGRAEDRQEAWDDTQNAANTSKNEKERLEEEEKTLFKENRSAVEPFFEDSGVISNIPKESSSIQPSFQSTPLYTPLFPTPVEVLSEKEETNLYDGESLPDSVTQHSNNNVTLEQGPPRQESASSENDLSREIPWGEKEVNKPLPTIRTPKITKVNIEAPISREAQENSSIVKEILGSRHFIPKKLEEDAQSITNISKYPKLLSWLNEFKGTK